MLDKELDELFEEFGYAYIPDFNDGCCHGHGRTDGKECCGGPQCKHDNEE